MTGLKYLLFEYTDVQQLREKEAHLNSIQCILSEKTFSTSN